MPKFEIGTRVTVINYPDDDHDYIGKSGVVLRNDCYNHVKFDDEIIHLYRDTELEEKTDVEFTTNDREGTPTRVGDLVIWATHKRGRCSMGRGKLTKIHGSGFVTIAETGNNSSKHVIRSSGFIKL